MPPKTLTENILLYDAKTGAIINEGSTTGQWATNTIGTTSGTGATNTITITNHSLSLNDFTIDDTVKTIIFKNGQQILTEDDSMPLCSITFSDPDKWNAKPNGFSKMNICNKPIIVNINIIVPEKVVEVTIYNGVEHTYKQVCKKPDIFDLKYALALAWAKYQNDKEVFGSRLNTAGIERAARQFLEYSFDYNKEFDRAIKAYNRWVKERDKVKAEEEERKAIIERRREKNRKRKEKMALRKKENEINTIAEAIRKAQKGEDNGK